MYSKQVAFLFLLYSNLGHAGILIPRGIVDGAGYALRNKAQSPESSALQANPPVPGENLGSVSLHPWDNSPGQKWGVEFFGSPTASLTPGMNRENLVTYFVAQGSSRLQTRQYSFTPVDSYYQVKNKENGLCLFAAQDSTANFADCLTEDNFLWIFERTG